MKTLMHTLAAVVVLAVVALAADAGDYYNGYVADGYTYNGGYWYLNGQAFTRERYWQPGWYSYPNGYCGGRYGCCCVKVWNPGYYFYKYFPYYPPQQTYAQLPGYKDAGWRTKLLDIAAARDKYEGEIRKGAFEHQQYLEAVQALGLTGNFRLQQYGVAPIAYGQALAYNGLLGVENFGVNANTKFGYTGYTYNSASTFYGSPLDINAALQQSAQLAERSITAGEKANTGFQGIVAAAGQAHSRVAETLARGQMIESIGKAMTLPPVTELRTQGYAFQLTPGQPPRRLEDPAVVTPESKAKLREAFEAVAEKRCGKCHSDADPKGGFKIHDYYTLAPDRLLKCWELLTTADNARRMPKGETPLSLEDLRLFFLVSGGSPAAQPPAK